MDWWDFIEFVARSFILRIVCSILDVLLFQTFASIAYLFQIFTTIADDLRYIGPDFISIIVELLRYIGLHFISLIVEGVRFHLEVRVADVVASVIFRMFKFLKKRVFAAATDRNSTSFASDSDSASASASASEFGGEYEVFLNYRGIDTGCGFTDFLYTYLVDAGIRTFRYDDELRVGGEIGPELLKSIEVSKISISIFSKNYASSEWCLHELAQMVECQRTMGQKIFPIFFDVEPSDVRHQSGSYEEAFRQHKKRFDKKTVQGWKDALREVGKLKGWELKQTNGRQGQLISMVVSKVLFELKNNYMVVTDSLVEVDHHVEKMDFEENTKKLKRSPSFRTAQNTSSTPSASASASGGKCDVFLSFRGEDTSKDFTDFLYKRLGDAGIRPFRNEDDLEDIGPKSLKAIQESKISIPIFSKNYASSYCCLRELSQMVECHRTTGQKILPIYYNINRSDVRRQEGSYEKAFLLHDNLFDEKIVQGWKEALTEVANLKGWHLKKETFGHQEKLVKMVVEKALLELKKNYMITTDNLVGIDHHVKQMRGLLNVDSDDVSIVGIHGMSGIGKTTIAKVIYNQLYEHFDHCGFLADVREMSQHHMGLVNLKNQLISTILKRKCPNIANVEEGINIFKDTVCGKKVLIVLDDVDRKSQFDYLVGKHHWFSPGSRIIVTTRDTGILDGLEVESRYEPPLMERGHSLQLFCKHAFRRESPPEDYDILSRSVVSTIRGLPLALEIIGSFLLGKGKVVWKDTLMKLEEIPVENVQEKLIISYKALNDEQKQIFLDIACLFTGKDKTNPFYMWDDCNFYPTNGIDVLDLRSLVKIGEDNMLWMHDQLRDLGRELVRKENSKEVWERSRLWHHEEALDIIKRHMRTEMVEALCLDKRLESGDPYFTNEDFKQLPNLRFLHVDNADLAGDFNHLLSKLRWLHWHGCPGNIKPINFYLINLVILDLSYSKITDDWDTWSQLKVAKRLKVLDLSYCVHLTRTPNFSTFATLERLILEGCENLVQIDPSIEYLINLRVLNISNSGVKSFADAIGNLPELPELELTLGCFNPQWEISRNIGGLSSSPASALGGEYEVFLSYRGKDTRYGFTDYLYNDLVNVGIRTFRDDDDDLHVGEEIGPEHQKVIQESRISIPIFSRGYAFSKCCLFELAQMVECLRTMGHKIFPIFYDVKPFDVQHQEGTYKEAFCQHEKHFDEKTIQGWKEALRVVGQLNGFELETETNGNEGELVKMVVSKVLFELKKNYMVVTDNLVGIDHHFEEMMRLLHVDCNDVLIVGIHGMDGIGKTTIAKVVYNELSERFECCSFLSNVQEILQREGIVNLQNKFLSKILNQKCFNMANVDEGIKRIKEMLSRKKVLIVLDDVDKEFQFDMLAIKREWFGLGSRIIVTTRNKEVLNVLKVDETYEPPSMELDQSLKLFSKHAFKRDFPPKGYVIVSLKVVSIVGGLPLALEIIGSFLFYQERAIWEETLMRLKKTSSQTVQKRLEYLANL
ncbi:hypothetical protein L1049_020423 [Liquidambar formosana]|uniref:TIR domain-containing protein n=1 Tax=Liquidambar formosana TaxID=63359 RepID=A0AAP0X605_LIQFO